MFKLLLLSALCSVALAGYAQQGYGHGGGRGHGQHGGHGHGHGHGGGYGHYRQYHGYGNVNVWQTPYAYRYGLQENGNGYSKWVNQEADFHNSYPVKTYGHGYGYSG